MEKFWPRDNEKEALRKLGSDVAEARKSWENSEGEITGLTQRELAEMVGTTEASIRRLERGETNVSVVVLARAAKVLGASLDKLLGTFQPQEALLDRTWEANKEYIMAHTAGMGLEEPDFQTKRLLLQMLKLWPK